MECLNIVAMKDTTEKIAFEPRPKGDEGPNVPGSTCAKAPESEACLSNSLSHSRKLIC